MACAAPQAATVWEGDINAPGCKFAVIVGQFNSLVTDRLESGALAALRKSSVDDADIDVVHVPGSFEIPVVAKAMAKTGTYDAVICIGAVVRGATTHYEEVCGAATTGCGHAAVSTGTKHAADILGRLLTDVMAVVLCTFVMVLLCHSSECGCFQVTSSSVFRGCCSISPFRSFAVQFLCSVKVEYKVLFFAVKVGGSTDTTVASGVPIIFGVITTETMEQALDRAGGKVGNKGFEAAMTAIEMASVMSKLRETGKAAPCSHW